MIDDPPRSPNEFGHLIEGLIEQVAESRRSTAAAFHARLRDHFGREPAQLATVRERVARSDHPDLQVALDGYLAVASRRATVIGISGGDFQETSFASLLAPAHATVEVSEGPVEYTNVPLAGDQVLPCVARGLFLIEDGERRHALLVAVPGSMSYRENLRVEVMSPERDHAVALLAELRKAMRARSVYRGQVISLEPGHESLRVRFHRLRPIAREEIVLPAGLLERIERHTIGFTRHRERLLAANRHLKPGLLLYGPPGTGKTLTAMYLATRMEERTTFLLTGRGLGLVEQSCAMARLLQPSTVILEDVDLVAEERTRQGVGCNPILFELLNQLDGLADDADVVFLLTTNRPDLLEPALASRPGRIDLAVELPAPDRDCRRRLIELYGRGLALALDDLDGLIERTDGVSAAFVRELLRKGALIAADDGSPAVADRHLDAALDELAVQGGELLRSLLGVRPPAAGAPGDRGGTAPTG